MRTHLQAGIGIVVAGIVSLAGPSPLHAVINGAADGNAHPNVGSFCIKLTAESEWSCFAAAATLVGPTVMVGVAHAAPFIQAVNPAVMAFSFEPVHSATPGDLFGSVRPLAEPTDLVESFHPHPGWNPDAFTNTLDIGVFVLRQPVAGVRPAKLPPRGLLDLAWRRTSGTPLKFTAVGNGVAETAEPLFDSWNERRVAATTGTLLTAGSVFTGARAEGEGVGCFGESGAPLFLGDTRLIVGVGSFEVGLCASFAYARLDTREAQRFLAQYVDLGRQH